MTEAIIHTLGSAIFGIGLMFIIGTSLIGIQVLWRAVKKEILKN